MNYYLMDLSSRQNRPVTTAEIHLYLCARRYSDKEIEECTLFMKTNVGKQLNLENKHADRIEKRHINPAERCEELEKELEDKYKEIESLKSYYINKLEMQKPENFFIYKNKLALIDNNVGKKLIIKYKSDLFEELITEFKKLYEWLDNRSAILKFNVEGNDVVIDRTEIHTVISFFRKLNAMKCDENEEN